MIFKVQSIYVGGGTPTSLNENDFDDLLSLVAKSFKGDYVEEFTVEAGRPDSLSLEKAKSISKIWCDRVSVNPQTMQDRTLSFNLVENILQQIFCVHLNKCVKLV